jgi:GNAT superfamily N-acetyltransferase
MTRAVVREFDEADLDAASELVAARFARLRAVEPRLAESASDPRRCRLALDELWQRPHVAGAVATWAGEPIGFVLAQANVTALDAPQSYFSPPHSVSTPLGAHACAGSEDPAEVYAALYAELAQRWVVDGFLDHGVGALSCEREVHDAFASLGFGRHFALALRGLEPLAEPTRVDLEIREAGEKELDDIFALSAELRAFHARAPMFQANPRMLGHGQEAMVRWLSRQPRCPAFLAYRMGRAVGMFLFAPSSFVSTPFRSDDVSYLLQAVVLPAERGGGAGAALLQHALTWLRREGFAGCGLHYLTGNPSGPPFWTRSGFRAAEYHLRRIVDPRIAWSAR